MKISAVLLTLFAFLTMQLKAEEPQYQAVGSGYLDSVDLNAYVKPALIGGAVVIGALAVALSQGSGHGGGSSSSSDSHFHGHVH